MKIKLKSQVQDSILETVFKNRGIEEKDIYNFLEPSIKNVISPTTYKNMEESYECVMNHINNKSRILVVVDSDADGFCSNAMLYSYLTMNFDVDIEYMIHTNKVHGFTSEVMSTVYEGKYELVLMADAGSSDYERHKELNSMGVDIVILDHHESEYYSEYAIVVNNQLDEGLVNKTLSGGGVVMKFLEYMDSKLGIDKSKYYTDLCAIAMVSDSMLMTELETRYYVKTGMSNIKNSFIYEILKKKDKIGFLDISFSVAPIINSIIRVGSKEDRENLFEVMVGANREMTLNIRGKGDVEMSLAEYVLKISDKCKRLQSKLINDLMQDGEFEIIQNGLPIVIGIAPIEFNANLSGLVANKLSDLFMKPSILLRLNDETTKYFGSGRTYKQIDGFKDFLIETGYFTHCEGHQGAFGCSIEIDKLSELIEYLKDKEEFDVETCYEVDAMYNNKTLNAFDIMCIGQMDNQWSKGFEKPLFYIKLENISKSNIDIIGKNKDTIRIKHKGITFVKFKCETMEIMSAINGENFNLELVGEFNINEWNGNSYPQVIVKDMEIEMVNLNEKPVINPFEF